MFFRTLASEDAAAFTTLRLRGLRECPEAFASSYEEEVDTPLAQTQSRLQPSPDSAIIGAFENSLLVGVVGLQRERMVKLSHKAFMWGVYVAPEARGRAVGMKLLRFALEYAALQLHVRQVNLGVNTTNTAALALYKKLGFKQYGLEREYLFVNDKYYDEYQMACVVHAGA